MILKMLRLINRYREENTMSKRIIILGIIIGILIIFVISVSVVLPQTYVTTDIKEYRNFSGHIQKEKTDIFSGLKIFPEEITEKMYPVSYYYECGNFALDNNYLIFLECQWAKEAFEQEIVRLENLHVEHNDQRKDILYMEDLFECPAYVSVYDIDQNESGSMEYALIDSNDRVITYIYSQLISNIREKVEEKYLPLNNAKGIELANGYNMYFFEMRQGEGEYIK